MFFECWVLNQLFPSPLSPLSRCSLVPLHFLPLKWHHLHICLHGGLWLIGGWSAPVQPVAAVRLGALCSSAAFNIGSRLPWTPFLATPAGPLPWHMATCWLTHNGQWRFTCSTRTSSGTTRALGMSSCYAEQLKGMSLLVKAWQNVVHWRREWQTTSVFLPWEPCEEYEKPRYSVGEKK